MFNEAFGVLSLRLVLCRFCLSPCRIFKQCRIHRSAGQMHVSDDGPSNEHIARRALSQPLAFGHHVTKFHREISDEKRTRCGHLSSSVASALSSLMLRY